MTHIYQDDQCNDADNGQEYTVGKQVTASLWYRYRDPGTSLCLQY